ncbi:hypothetical protein GCM10023189_19980 [Nibrella saemangeumensis]|uniref:PKD domain-containing protein n=1 Tax=Nibrella saemangeumensis TaxID=1084526 RepID=A0ABP8MR72_9BACT
MTWPCGSAVTVGNAFLAWGINKDDNVCAGGFTCDNIISSKCGKDPTIFPVAAPLVASFISATACVAGQTTQSVSFTNTTASGTKPYSFTYNYGDGTSEPTTSTLVTHQYTTTGTKSVTLIVKDANGTIDTQVNQVVVGSCCQFFATCPANTTLGTFTCSTLANIPPPPTTVSALTSAPYNMTIGNNPCGTIRITSVDNATVNVCSQSNQTITRTITVWDDLDNSNTINNTEVSQICTFTYTVEADLTPPSITAPANVTVQCAANVPAPVPNTLANFASDNCGGTVTVTHVSDVISNSICANSYTITRTYMASDPCSNTATAIQTIVVNDTQQPAFNGIPANVTISCGTSVPPAFTATVSDNCSGTALVAPTESQTGSGCNYIITRVWTYSDGCTAPISATQTITVRNNSPQLVGVPANVTVACNAVPSPANVTGQDDCVPDIQVNFTSTLVPGSCANNYVVYRVWTVDDGCNAPVSATQVVAVVDNQPPQLIGVPANLTVACNAVPPVASVTAQDNCVPNIQPTFSTNTVAGSCSGNYVIYRVWTVNDGCNAPVSATQTIAVVDNQPPMITCPVNVTVACTSAVTPNITGLATATDNCSGTLSPTYTDQVSACADGSYIITRTWSVTDACGNPASCSQLITVKTAQNAGCFTANLTSMVFDGTNTHFTFSVSAKGCASALSYIAFIINKNIGVVSPTNGSTYTGLHNAYKVSVPVSKKAHGIKYDVIGEGIKNNDSDVFAFVLAGDQTGAIIEVETKAGKKTESTDLGGPNCICQNSPARIATATESAETTELTVKAFPNPHNGRVFLQITSPVDGTANIDWYTTSGSKVDALKVNVQKGVNEPVSYEVKGNQAHLLYRVTVGGKSASGTIISGK